MLAYVLVEGTVRSGTIVSVPSWLPELMLQVFIPKSKKLASSHLGPMMVVAPKTVLARLVVAVALQTFGSAVGGCMALQLLIWLSRPVFDKAALLLLPQQVNELLPIMKPKYVLSSTPTRSVKQRAFNSSHWLLKQLAGAGAQRP
jgi:hypothetical protein